MGEGEEVKITEYNGGEYVNRVSEWEVGLPTADDLTPLSYSLITPELAAAFSITPEPYRSMLEVNLESENTISSLRGQFQLLPSSNNFSFKPFCEENGKESLPVETDETDLTREGSGSRKVRRIDSGGLEEADSALRTEVFKDDSSARTQKRPRLVWTPQLHKRFVDVVAHLGIKTAVPKTIMQMMNVEGLTRENVASHLQKYRLYLKRMQGFSNDGPSSSDQLFASTPVSQSLQDSGGSGQVQAPAPAPAPAPVPIPMPYAPPMMPMQFYGMAQGHGHMAMPGGNTAPSGFYHGFESHQYHMVQHRDWPGSR